MFFCKAIQARKMCFMIFQHKKTVFQALKKRSSKSRKIEIFSKGLVHGFRPKLAIFPCFFFKAIQARKMCFTICYNEKMVFQALKTRSSKSQKIEIFSKGLVHGFRPKLVFFHVFFKGNIGQENVFYDILERKNSFQALKTRSSKSRKIEIFSKGLVHGFQLKLAIFPCFFVRQYMQGKCVL